MVLLPIIFGRCLNIDWGDVKEHTCLLGLAVDCDENHCRRYVGPFVDCLLVDFIKSEQFDLQ